MSHYVPKQTSSRDDLKFQELQKHIRCLISVDDSVSKRVKAAHGIARVLNVSLPYQRPPSQSTTTAEANLLHHHDKILATLRQLLSDKHPQVRSISTSLIASISISLLERADDAQSLSRLLSTLVPSVATTPATELQQSLLITKEIVTSCSESVVSRAADMLATSLKSCLVGLTSVELIPPILDILEVCNKRVVQLFDGSEFADLVDCLVGWRVDVTTPPDILRAIDMSFAAFSKTWARNLAFTTTILNQIASDISRLIEPTTAPQAAVLPLGLHSKHNGPSQPASSAGVLSGSSTHKVSLQAVQFSSTFVSIAVAVGTALTSAVPLDAGIANALSKFLLVLRNSFERSIDKQWIIFISQRLYELAIGFQAFFISLIPKCLDVFLALVSTSYAPRTGILRDALPLFSRILETVHQPLPGAVIQRLIHPDLCALRTHSDAAVVHSVRMFYSIAIKNSCKGRDPEPICMLVAHLCDELTSMLPKLESTQSTDISFMDDVVKLSIFNLSILTQLGLCSNASHLRAPLDAAFDCVSQFCDPIRSRSVRELPSLHFVAVEAALTLARAYSMPVVSHAAFFNILLDCLHDSRPTSIKSLALQFLIHLGRSSNSSGRLVSEKLFRRALLLAVDPDPTVRILCADTLRSLLLCSNSHCMSPSQVDSALACAVGRAADANDRVKAAFCDLAADLCMMSTWAQRHLDAADRSSPVSARLFRHLHSPAIKREIISSFSGSSILSSPKVELGKIVNMLFIPTSEGIGPERLARLFCTSMAMTKSVEVATPMLKEIISSIQISSGLLEFWAATELAQTFVGSRLRSPFGGPAQTLEAIEKLLAMKDASNLVGPLDLPNHSTTRACFNVLDFLDILEKHMYHAYEGSFLLGQCAPPSTTWSFFRANRKVCVDWFIRVRSRALVLSWRMGSFSNSIRNGFDRLSYLARFVAVSTHTSPKLDPALLKREFELALLPVACAMLESRESDSLEGLYRWTKSVFKRRKSEDVPEIRWLPAFIAISRGKYEKATELIRDFFADISSMNLDSMKESGILGAVMSKLMDCYAALGNWPAVPTHGISMPKWSSLFLEALADFDACDYSNSRSKVKDLLSMELPFEVNDYDARLHRSRFLLLDSLAAICLIKVSSESVTHSTIASQLSTARELISPLIDLIGSDDPKYIRSILVQLQCIRHAQAVLESDASVPSVTSLLWSLPHQDTANIDVGHWNDLFRVDNAISSETSESDKVQRIYPLLKLARKSSNFALADRLSQSLTSVVSGHVSELASFERAKLLHAQGQHYEALSQTWLLTRQLLGHVSVGSTVPTIPDATVRIFLKFARWLQQCEKQPLVIDQLAQVIPPLRSPLKSSTIAVEAVVGAVLREATELAPQNSNAWFKYADWLYRNGHRVAKQFLRPNDLSPFTPAERSRLELLLARCSHLKTDEQRRDALLQLLVKVLPRVASESSFADGSDASQHSSGFSNPSSREDIISRMFCSAIGSEDSSLSKEFLLIFWDIRKRFLLHYRNAIESYLKFLHIHASNSSREPGITATLRILRLLALFGSDLNFPDALSPAKNGPSLALGTQLSLGDQLEASPASAWRDVVPQLFARLSSKDEFVRNQVLLLIKKVAKEFPKDVVYALLGGSTAETMPIESIRAALGEHSIHLLQDVETFVGELNKIAQLPEERSLVALRELYTDVNTRLRTVKGELARLDQSVDLEKFRSVLAESFGTIMKPAVAKLERLTKDLLLHSARPTAFDPVGNTLVDSIVPSTTHERWFLATYKELFDSAVHSLKHIPQAVAELDSVCSPIRDLIKSLSQHNKRTSLRLDVVSSRLCANLSGVPLPGDSTLLVVSIENDIHVLPTKTRPKKLVFCGSDGQRYSYLLKGREDLHLDERIMQFLSTVNLLLRRDKPSDNRALRTRHYAVTPLGRVAGLIQWVDDTVPLYKLHVEWQRRSSLKSGTATLPSADPASTEPSSLSDETVPKKPNQLIVKPIDLFYSKLFPALTAAGVPQSNHLLPQSRTPDVLRRVFLELEKETPRDLLERELWCASANTADWFQKTLAFSRSVAVMSIVGYVIGLGDRHLDNILLDFSTGEVVHIDYNVCFEKGLKLRIPELVPFRLTQTMQRALGVTGVDGTFRFAAEHTLSVLRSHRETLLTLLEAFVYDPLVDWTTEDKMLAEERSMELDVACTLLSSRIGSVADPSSLVAAFFDSCRFIEADLRSTCKFFETSNKALVRVRACESEMNASVHRVEEIKFEIAKVALELQSNAEAAKSLILDEKALEESKSPLFARLGSFVEEQSRMHVQAQQVLSYLLQDPSLPVSVLAPLPITLQTESIPHTLAQRATLVLLGFGEEFCQKCLDDEEQMSRLLVLRQNLLCSLVDKLAEYARHVALITPTEAYLESSQPYQLMRVVHQLLSSQRPSSDLLQILQSIESPHLETEHKTLHFLHQHVTCARDELASAEQRLATLQSDTVVADTKLREHKWKIDSLVRDLSATAGSPAVGCLLLQDSAMQFLHGLLEQIRTCSSQDMRPKQFQSRLFRIADQAAFLCLLLGDAWSSVDPASSAQFTGSSVYLTQQNMYQLERFSSDFARVIFPEIIKASAASDPSLISCASELRRISSALDLPNGPLIELFSAYMELTALPSSLNPSSSGGRIVLAACDKLFDSVIDQFYVQFLSEKLGFVPPFSLIFGTTFDSAVTQLRIQKILCISSIFETVSSSACSQQMSQQDMDDIVSGIITSYVYACSRILYAPTLQFCVQDLIARSKSTLAPTSPNTTLQQLLERYCAAVVSYQDLSEASLSQTSIVQKFKTTLQIRERDLERFMWLQGEADFLPKSSKRSSLLSEIETLSNDLLEMDKSLSACETSYSSHETAVLKAARSFLSSQQTSVVPDHFVIGALHLFQDGVLLRQGAMQLLHDRSTRLRETADHVIAFERNKKANLDVVSTAKTYISLLDASSHAEDAAAAIGSRVKELCQLRDSLKEELNAHERVVAQNADMIANLRSQEPTAGSDIKAALPRLAKFFLMHSQLRVEVEPLLSSISRITDRWTDAPGVPHLHASARKLQHCLKQTEDLMSTVQQIAFADSSSLSWPDPANSVGLKPRQFDGAITNCPLIDDSTAEIVLELVSRTRALLKDLQKLCSEWLQGTDIEDEDGNTDSDDSASDTDEGASTSRLASETESNSALITHKTSPQPMQTRNQTAVSVLKRVKQKLEGSDGGGDSGAFIKRTVPEQVGWVIREATSVDNLSKMYEGWTAWI